MKGRYKWALLAGSAVLIAVLGALFIRQHPGARLTPGAAKGAPSYWYDPMHPNEHFDKPGKSPFMDMQLLPKYADGAPNIGSTPASASAAAGARPGTISVDSRLVQTLGLRLEKVERGSFSRVLDTVGSVGVDEHRIEAIQVREPGWVERLEVRAAGDTVRRGQLLAGIYSPDLLATQQELLIARSAGDPKLIEAARHRLALFGVSAGQITRVEKSDRVERRVDYYAPFDGYVIELGVRQGAAVQPGTTLFQLADLTSVWVLAEIPESQAAWLEPGDPADLDLPARPGERFRGRVDYVYPELTQATRTLKARIVVGNPSKHLRPGMFAAVHIHGAGQRRMLTLSSEAVIRTGTRSVVIVADDGTHFRPVLVRVGAEYDGRSEILEGLTAGQNVVASGQFLIDSEANLRGAFDHLTGPTGH
ncbi:MAG TPA: efflux RND transporter periplasmic adaptor subunit [Steroidobacteraceae bacterium]|nr:efflux RND transporter periplasmic adaptor subunit [Steroidobacteraceae bacterium]